MILDTSLKKEEIDTLLCHKPSFPFARDGPVFTWVHFGCLALAPTDLNSSLLFIYLKEFGPLRRFWLSYIKIEGSILFQDSLQVPVKNQGNELSH